jgi:flagellar biosynthesis protein FlhF
MRLKLYRAPAMAQAIARVRAELGGDALILATRRVGDGVEVTAALEPDEPQQALPDPARLAMLDFHGVPAPLCSALEQGDFQTALADRIAFATLPFGEQPLLFVGPPGAGKTLTVARLATRLVLAGTVPMVITADGRRAGATSELAAFTKLLGVSLVVACHPVTLGRALTRRQPASPVLIDTPGCNVFDPAQLEEITTLAATAAASMVLVLPAGLDPAEAADLARAYADAGAHLLVATRLDLARRLGGILAAADAGLALTEAGIGPGAADGLLPITPEWLAARLLTGMCQ